MTIVSCPERQGCSAERIWYAACTTLGIPEADDPWKKIVEASPPDSIWHSLRNCVAYQVTVTYLYFVEIYIHVYIHDAWNKTLCCGWKSRIYYSKSVLPGIHFQQDIRWDCQFNKIIWCSGVIRQILLLHLNEKRCFSTGFCFRFRFLCLTFYVTESCSVIFGNFKTFNKFKIYSCVKERWEYNYCYTLA